MSLLHYIDNEVPPFGQWDSVVAPGSATITEMSAAAWPERGSTGVRVDLNGETSSFLQKNISPTRDTLSLGAWVKFYSNAADNGGFYLLDIGSGALMLKFAAGSDQYRVYDGSAYANAWTALPAAVRDGRWHHWALYLKSGTGDGQARVFLDGAVLGEWTGRTFGGSFSSIRVAPSLSWSPFMDDPFDIDEVKVVADATSDGYVEPYSPTPADEYPSAARTVVLYRQADSYSESFAYYCATELGVPRANLCPLPNASANETLADYATFQAEVETDLASWLGRNTAVAANCSCFLIGYGVPGYFTSGGVKHSAASRLMNFGTAFSSQTANPLYNPATVARLTKAGLGGKYLACRVDADILANAKDIVERGSLPLAATDTLYSDDAAYRASLACQHLRMITAAMGTFTDDAFVFGNTGTPSFGSGPRRASFVDDSASSASTLRASTDAIGAAMLTAGYPTALGNSETADTFDAESFFEMLRIGGTFAEAAAVSIANLDYTAVPVGYPLFGVTFQLGGYNVYRGVGGVDSIDWAAPVAYARPNQSNVTFAQDLPPDVRYVYGVRAVSASGVEQHGTHVVAHVQLDSGGVLLPEPLARPADLAVRVIESGDLSAGFSYHAGPGFAWADGFDVLGDAGTGLIDPDNPIATVEASGERAGDYEVSIPDPQTALLLAVRARRGAALGPMSGILSVPLRPSPALVQLL